MNRTFAVGLLACLLSACGQKNIQTGSTLRVDSRSSILVLGMRPNYRVALLHGRIADGVWVRPTIDTPEVNTTPNDDGYIVVKVEPTTDTDKLGVSLILVGGRLYGPCAGYRNPIFTVPPGTITYVGDINYNFDGSRLRFSTSADVQKARAHIAAKYSASAPFEFHPMQVLEVRSGLCNRKTVMIPIFLPSVR